MADKVKRIKTKYKNIYLNQKTGKYDVKYNYKTYNSLKQKNEYKSKWIYSLASLSEAKAELAKLQAGQMKAEDKDITLQGILELWKVKAQGQNFSPLTVKNTEQYMNMIYQFLPAGTRLKDITEDGYYKLLADCRSHGYSEETLHSINATFRKMINHAYKKKLIEENILVYADNIKTRQKEDYRVINKEEFDRIDDYFKNNGYWRLGINNYPKYRLLVNILYYCGLRIGEALALTYDDFEVFDYGRRAGERNPWTARSGESAEDFYQQGMRIRVTKAYVTEMRLTKDPKNLKRRTVPLASAPECLYMEIREEHLLSGGSMEDKIFTWGHSACNMAIGNACRKLNLPEYNCHEFRHTYISNLIKRGVPLPVIEKVSGDTQQTILSRYSHMFEQDEILVLMALESL